ncbi:MAG: tyrosine-type recombinase/integrase, partial [Spirochaetaceae bacterium]|nr:tyrosine-type recombinase/integrase [Spirochaetaceae bacterium]
MFYYRAYSEDGNRQCGHSTGMTTKSEAREYCYGLMREGKLLSIKKEKPVTIPTFEEYAKGWWDFDTCPYLNKRKSRRSISKSYARQAQRVTSLYLITEFGKRAIDKITTFEVDKWLSSFREKGLSNNTANLAFKILKLMLGEAKLSGVIKSNPCEPVKLLPANQKQIDILTPEEVKAIFPADWRTVWSDEYIYILNKLAACSGMRFGELLGLKGEYLYDGYINVCAQFSVYGYGDVKTHKPRNIPIPKVVEADLNRLKQKNGNGFLFSKDGGNKPISRPVAYKGFFKALEKIGIDKDAREKRHLSMHGWRHFFNTTMLMANVSDTKVMSMTGHSSVQMKEHYTHFDTTKFSEVVAVQENLLCENKPIKT